MGNITQPEKVKLIAGIFSSSGELIKKAANILKTTFGDIDYQSPFYNFTQTDYYTNEMGKGLLKGFFSFKELIRQEDIASIKIKTNSIEKEFLKDGKRLVNIDPGFISSGKLVLATTKDQQHRIFVSQGIYAEVTLRFVHGSFTVWEWTYRDYQTQEYIDTFNKIRELYRKQLLS